MFLVVREQYLRHFSTAWYDTVQFRGVFHWVQYLIPGTFFSTTSVEVPSEPLRLSFPLCLTVIRLCMTHKRERGGGGGGGAYSNDGGKKEGPGFTSFC